MNAFQPQPVARLLNDKARHRMFAGDVLVQRSVPAMGRVVEQLGHMAANAFHPQAPHLAHEHLGTADYLARLKALRRGVRQDSGVAAVFAKLLGELGADADDTFSDRLNFRLVPPLVSHQGRPADPLKPHRDTWGSGLLSQINLWAPLAPLDADATMVLYPEAWDRAIDNDSVGWDIQALRAARGAGDTYPRLPTATGDIAGPAMPILIEPGDMLAFSGAHLHASRAAATGVARMSFDFRLVMLSDARADLGAPDHDHAAPHQAPEWFKRPADGLGLAKALSPLLLGS